MTLEPTPAMPAVGGEIEYLGITLRRYSKVGFELHLPDRIQVVATPNAREHRAYWKAMNRIREIKGLPELPQPCKQCGLNPRRRQSDCCEVCKPARKRKQREYTPRRNEFRTRTVELQPALRTARIAADALIARRFGIDKVPKTLKPEDDFNHYMRKSGYRWSQKIEGWVRHG